MDSSELGLEQLSARDGPAVHSIGPIGQAERARGRVCVRQLGVLGDARAAPQLNRSVDHGARSRGRDELDQRDLLRRRAVAEAVHAVRGGEGEQARAVEVGAALRDKVVH